MGPGVPLPPPTMNREASKAWQTGLEKRSRPAVVVTVSGSPEPSQRGLKGIVTLESGRRNR